MSGGSTEPRGGDAAARAIRRIAKAVSAEEGPTVVGLLADREAPEASREQAGRLCDAVAERRRTLVVNLGGAGSGFDRFLGAGDGAGLEGVRTGRIRLSEAPVQIDGRRFLYLPAGEVDPGAEEDPPPPLEDPSLVDAVERLADRIRQAGGALLLYLKPEALPDRGTADLLDGAVRLAGAVGVAGVTTLGRLDVGEGGPDESVEAFLGLPEEPEGTGATATEAVPPAAGGGRPEPGEGEASVGAGEADAEADPGDGGREPGAPLPWAAPAPPAAGTGPRPEPPPESSPEPDRGTPPSADDAREPAAREAAGRIQAGGTSGPERGRPAGGPGEGGGEGSGWRRHRRSTGLPRDRILLGAALVAALVGGWWYFASRTIPGDGPAAAGDRAAQAAGPTGSGGGDAPAAAAGAPPADAEGPGSGEPAGVAVLEEAPELGWSVLVASFRTRAAARRRLDRWGGEPGAPVLFAAPTPVRDEVYWRIFAGALAEREAGEDLNAELVRRGWKEEATGWEIRPAGQAFRLAVEASRGAADERVAAHRDREVPAYALPADADGDTVWAVWAGAYESRAAAALLGRSLREKGIEAELTTRRGADGGT